MATKTLYIMGIEAMHRSGFTTSLLLIFCWAGLAFGQESLLIGPGDQLHVEIFDTPQMEQHPRVTDAGEIPLMFVGNLRVMGLTPAEAAQAIEQALRTKEVMLHPQVTVKVEQFGIQGVSVMGQVEHPGAYPITTALPILKVLSLAGGMTELADRHLTIQRRGDEKHSVNYFLSNDSQSAFSTQVLIYPGDTILVPKVGVVYVLGDVGHPGGYPITNNDNKMTVLQVVALAGSVTRTSSLRIRLLRKTATGTEDVPLSLAAIREGKEPDRLLQANDVLYVPFSWMKNVTQSVGSIMASTSGAAVYAAR